MPPIFNRSKQTEPDTDAENTVSSSTVSSSTVSPSTVATSTVAAEPKPILFLVSRLFVRARSYFAANPVAAGIAVILFAAFLFSVLSALVFYGLIGALLFGGAVLWARVRKLVTVKSLPNNFALSQSQSFEIMRPAGRMGYLLIANGAAVVFSVFSVIAVLQGEGAAATLTATIALLALTASLSWVSAREILTRIYLS